MIFTSIFRGILRTLTVLVVVFISYGGVGLLADIRASVVRAEEGLFTTVAFEHPFSSIGTLHESVSPEGSSSPYFWVLSGGKLLQSGGVGKTIQGELVPTDAYFEDYARDAALVSDQGQHPQNDFRLLTRSMWENVREEITVTINGDNLDNAKNRQPWNGIDLIARYKDSNNFYYGTLRMDGRVSIKKRVQGVNGSLADVSYFSGSYSAIDNPTLLPKDRPLRLALETLTNANGSVTLRMYGDKENSGVWKLIAETTDTTNVLLGKGRSGFYSDFMDVTFDNYRLLTRGAEVSATPVTGLHGLSVALTLQESPSVSTSGSTQWWLNSGAYFVVKDNIGKTNQGSLESMDPWRVLYAVSNPRDTDGGYHPQNIFRLLTKSTFRNVEQKAYFNIQKYNVSESPLRAEHNGLLFFNRYQDGDNLYYTGLRVDGSVIIKKKLKGTYYTLASKKILSGIYNRDSNPNLIPTVKWLGLKSVITDLPDSSVRIRVYTDLEGRGVWTQVAEVIDDGSSGGSVVSAKASGGIRTDYMDVWFKDYSIREL